MLRSRFAHIGHFFIYWDCALPQLGHSVAFVSYYPKQPWAQSLFIAQSVNMSMGFYYGVAHGVLTFRNGLKNTVCKAEQVVTQLNDLPVKPFELFLCAHNRLPPPVFVG